ncbi:hypothetical protein AAFC00_004003 [Neodothiora populina]|uniref:Phospholipid/glycerol acyltransferase domain-containing protein n=1 Tax=Neodothiora populina TaxID=2781224 RepID=A0ABR3PI75_9PEZI
MEKYSAFRDRGSGIAPFFPIPTQPAGVALPFHVFLFVVRVTILLPFSLLYFLVLAWLPIGSLGKKAALWVMLGVPGIWWIDLAVDGVKKGSLGQNQHRLPHPGSVIASSHTSPIDALYLAAIFDPIFTQSFPNERKVLRIGLWQAMLNALLQPALEPPKGAKLVDIAALLAHRPDRCIAIFPESTATNGRGILPFSPGLLTVPARTKIFPVSLRYTPADITTPVPGAWFDFTWNLCSKPTHCIRVRIAEAVYNDAAEATSKEAPRRNSYETNLLDDLHARPLKPVQMEANGSGYNSEAEKRVLDKIAEALARLGRVKRLGLGVEDKIKFVKVWSKRR